MTKNTVIQTKWQPTEWEKMFATCILNIGIISKLSKEKEQKKNPAHQENNSI